MRIRERIVPAATLLWCAFLCALVSAATSVHAASRRPNVVIIFADDLGYGDVGYQGAPDIPTPNIDALASSGVRFTDGYVTMSVCSPSRAGLLTGRYQNRFGFEMNPGPVPPQAKEAGMATSEVTLAQILKEAGYATGMVGKWHLGMQDEHHPMNRGFDEFFGFLHGAHSYLDPMAPTALGDPILRGFKPAVVTKYLTDVFTDEALAFIDRHKQRPFFLYLAYNAVHTPLEATPQYLKHVTDVAGDDRRTYAAMTVALDDGVGAVLAKLEQAGLADNTLLFFLSDNGGFRRVGRNAPLRGWKATMWEGGIRIPFCVRWPARLPRDKVFEHPAISLDIVPTVVAAAGAKLPEGRPIDGVDLLPYLTGEVSAPPHETLYWRAYEYHALRRGKWKLVKMGDEHELYDLSQDIGESRNLATERPDILKELEQAFESWSSQMTEPLWSFPSPEEIEAYRKSQKDDS